MSAEPLLGPLDLTRIALGEGAFEDVLGDGEWRDVEGAPPGIDWVIVGGESGPGARTFDLAWARSLVAQCRAAGVAAFVKQVGAKPCDSDIAAREWIVSDRKGGDPDEWPADLRVRQLPAAARIADGGGR